MDDITVHVGPLASDLATSAVLLRVPIVRSCEVIEFGVFNFGGAAAGDADGALELLLYDGIGASVTVLRTLLGSAEFDIGEILVGRTSVFVDTVFDRHLIGGTATAIADGLTCLGLRIKSSAEFASSSTGQVYMIVKWGGSGGGTATGTVAGVLS